MESVSLYEVCTGTITNNGDRSYTYVKVKACFNSASGTNIDTDWTYAVDGEGLAPGESRSYTIEVPKNSRIYTVSVSITDD